MLPVLLEELKSASLPEKTKAGEKHEGQEARNPRARWPMPCPLRSPAPAFAHGRSTWRGSSAPRLPAFSSKPTRGGAGLKAAPPKHSLEAPGGRSLRCRASRGRAAVTRSGDSARRALPVPREPPAPALGTRLPAPGHRPSSARPGTRPLLCQHLFPTPPGRAAHSSPATLCPHPSPDRNVPHLPSAFPRTFRLGASAVPNSWQPCLFRTPDSPSVPRPGPLFSVPFQAAFFSPT